jgi:hypothetical protein
MSIKLLRILCQKLLDFLFFLKLQLLTKSFKSWKKCETYCRIQNLRKFNYHSTLYTSSLINKKKFKYILLTRNNFRENHSYVAQYTNEGYVPVQQVSYKKLAILIKKNHYKVIREVLIKESILEGNLGKNSFGKDLVIAKI